MTKTQGSKNAPPDGGRDPRPLQIQAHFDAYLPHCRRISLGELPVSADLYEHNMNSPCIVFIPGIGTYSEYYCEYLFKLSLCGFNVLGIDPRGHGYSGGARGYYRIDEVVADFQLALDYLSEHYNGRIGVIGSSIGARLGLGLAEADHRVRSLLCHTLFLSEFPPDIWHQIGWQSVAFTAFWVPDFRIDLHSFIDIEGLMNEFPLGRYAMTDERMVWSYPVSTLKGLYSTPSKVVKQSLHIPACVLIGGEDKVIRPDYVRDLTAYTAQKFDVNEIPGAGHMLPLADSDRMADETRAWFDRTL